MGDSDRSVYFKEYYEENKGHIRERKKRRWATLTSEDKEPILARMRERGRRERERER